MPNASQINPCAFPYLTERHIENLGSFNALTITGQGFNIVTVADMGTPGLVVALFDLDGTLCNARYLPASLISYRLKRPTRIPRAVIYIINQAVRLLCWKVGLLNYARVVKAGAQPFASLLKGLSTSEAFSLFSEAAQTTANTARKETLKILRWHQEEGHIVILVSGGFQPFLSEVGRLLGINHTIGTSLEEIGNFYTGRLIGPFCHGDDRARLVRQFIKASGFDVNLSSSYAYGDRAQDIPTMEMVGHPVAVYPDKELLTYANQRGWRVIGASAAHVSS